jgi:hypothetical protein
MLKSHKTLCVFFAFLQAVSLAAAVIWNGAESDEWNTVDHNWLGDPVFQPGYDVTINGSHRIFIGLDRVPVPVAPRSMMTSGAITFWGGDIQTGGIFLFGFSSLMFSNYSTSLSFPGGLRVAGGSRITYDVREAPHNAQLNLGTGNILFEDGALGVLVGTGKIATLTNPLIISNTATLRLQEFGPHTNGPIRFSGDVHLYGTLNIQSMGSNRFAPDELAGAIRIKYRPTSVSIFFNGSYGTRSLDLSGPIITDLPQGGAAGTVLQLQNYGLFGVRITNPANTYDNGTLIMWSPSAPKAAIEVAADSSLGTGNVQVQGLLHLKGSRNMGTNALLLIDNGGQVHLGAGVILRLRGLRLGTTSYSTGVFSSNNAPGYITGPGEIRLPHNNLRPTILATDPPNRTVYAGTDVPFHVSVNDPDGKIVKVVFTFFENMVIREVTSPPWTYVFSNAPPPFGIWYGQAFAYDDEGLYNAVGLSDVRTIEPPVPVLRNPRSVNSNAFTFDFDALANVKYSVEAKSSLTDSNWSSLYLLPSSPVPGTLSVTNAVAPTDPSRFFRIRAGHQLPYFW